MEKRDLTKGRRQPEAQPEAGALPGAGQSVDLISFQSHLGETVCGGGGRGPGGLGELSTEQGGTSSCCLLPRREGEPRPPLPDNGAGAAPHHPSERVQRPPGRF